MNKKNNIPASARPQSGDPYANQIISWLRGLTEPLHAPLEGKNAPLMAHPSLYGPLSDRIECFTRPLLAVAPWLSGRTVATLPNADAFAAAARSTILRGTDPSHPEYWGKMQDIYQPICLTSSLAWSLHNARKALWEPLTKSQQNQVADWLADVQGKKVSDSNWHLFPAVTMAFLASEGYPVNQQELRQHFTRVFEDFYGGGGWYRDGSAPTFDSYNGNQMHPYFQMLNELGAVPPEMSGEVNSRTVQWADSLLNLFDEEGVAPFWGRSAVYRMNFLDGVAMALRRGLPVAKPGDWRKAIAGCCDYFALDAILGKDGYLLPGYLGTKEDMLDWYSVRGSAYWLGRNCHLIQVPSDSPFWNQAPGTWTEGLVHLAPLPMAMNRRSRHVVVWNLGITHHVEKYAASKYHNLLFSGRFGQVYESGAAALLYKQEGAWKVFHSWNPVATDATSATVRGKAGANELEIRFAVGENGGNRITVRNVSSTPIEIRLGGFAVSGTVKEQADGLAGVEGVSILKPIRRLTRSEPGQNDGIHLWAKTFQYPVATGTLAGGAEAEALIAGQPGKWTEVLKLHGGE